MVPSQYIAISVVIPVYSTISEGREVLTDHRIKTRTLSEQDIMDFFYYSSLLFFLQFYTLSEGRPNSDIDIGTCKCQSFQTCQWSNESFERINSKTQFPGETQLFKGNSVLKPCIYFFCFHAGGSSQSSFFSYCNPIPTRGQIMPTI